MRPMDAPQPHMRGCEWCDGEGTDFTDDGSWLCDDCQITYEAEQEEGDDGRDR